MITREMIALGCRRYLPTYLLQPISSGRIGRQVIDVIAPLGKSHCLLPAVRSRERNGLAIITVQLAVGDGTLPGQAIPALLAL